MMDAPLLPHLRKKALIQVLSTQFLAREQRQIVLDPGVENALIKRDLITKDIFGTIKITKHGMECLDRCDKAASVR